jgi:hypothetical protein
VLRWSRAILGSAVERPRDADSKPRAGREEETLRPAAGVDCRFKAMRRPAELANRARASHLLTRDEARQIAATRFANLDSADERTGKKRAI